LLPSLLESVALGEKASKNTSSAQPLAALNFVSSILISAQIIEEVYNAKRLRSTLGSWSPNEFDKQLARKAA